MPRADSIRLYRFPQDGQDISGDSKDMPQNVRRCTTECITVSKLNAFRLNADPGFRLFLVKKFHVEPDTAVSANATVN